MEADDRTNEEGGRDHCLEELWASLARSEMHEMGTQDSAYKWRSAAGASYMSTSDKFLWSLELMDRFCGADVHAIRRPL